MENKKEEIQREFELSIIHSELERFKTDLLLIWRDFREKEKNSRSEIIEAIFDYLDGRLSDVDVEIFEIELFKSRSQGIKTL